MTRQRSNAQQAVKSNAQSVIDTRKAESTPDYGLKDWDDARLILALGRFGNFQAAAQYLNTDQTTVSRRYRRLEQALGIKLFERQDHRLVSTLAGNVVIERAQAMENIAKEIGRTLGAVDARPQGIVKIAVTEGLGHLWLVPRLVELCSDHPDIDIELVPSHGEYDLLLKTVDIAIGYARPDKTRLVARKVARIHSALFAAPAYLAKAAPITDATKLSGHDLIIYESNMAVPSMTAWYTGALVGNRVKLRTSSAAMALAAVRGGLGIGLAPSFYEDVYDETDIARLPLTPLIPTEVWLVSHEETNTIRRVRLVIDFLTEAFKQDISRSFKKAGRPKKMSLEPRALRAKPPLRATRSPR